MGCLPRGPHGDARRFSPYCRFRVWFYPFASRPVFLARSSIGEWQARSRSARGGALRWPLRRYLAGSRSTRSPRSEDGCQWAFLDRLPDQTRHRGLADFSHGSARGRCDERGISLPAPRASLGLREVRWVFSGHSTRTIGVTPAVPCQLKRAKRLPTWRLGARCIPKRMLPRMSMRSTSWNACSRRDRFSASGELRRARARSRTGTGWAPSRVRDRRRSRIRSACRGAASQPLSARSGDCA